MVVCLGTHSWVFLVILGFSLGFLKVSWSFGQLWSTLWWWGRVSSEVSRAGQSTFLPLPSSYLLTHPIPLISYVFPYTYSYLLTSSFFNTCPSHSAHLQCSPPTYFPISFRSSPIFSSYLLIHPIPLISYIFSH